MIKDFENGKDYQTEKETVERIEITYAGALAEQDTGVLSLSVLKGFLSVMSPENVNYVNAELILNSMGIKLVESKTSHLDKYTNLITVNFVTKKGNNKVSGTVFAKDAIRIVDLTISGYLIDHSSACIPPIEPPATINFSIPK